MPTVRQLARETLKNIKEKQIFLTHQSKKDAIQKIEAVLNSPDATADDIIHIFKDVCKEIQNQKIFGCLGESGSYFIKRSNEFL